MELAILLSIIVLSTLSLVIYKKIKNRHTVVVYYKNGKYRVSVGRLKVPVEHGNNRLDYRFKIDSRQSIFRFFSFWISEENYTFRILEEKTMEEMVDLFFYDWYNVQIPLEDIKNDREKEKNSQENYQEEND